MTGYKNLEAAIKTAEKLEKDIRYAKAEVYSNRLDNFQLHRLLENNLQHAEQDAHTLMIRLREIEGELELELE